MAYNSQKIAHPGFGLKLTPTDGELYIGGDNAEQYTGDIEYHPVVSPAPTWTLGDATVFLDGEEHQSNVTTMLDTGTPFVFGPWDVVREIYETSNHYYMDPDTGLVAYNCSSVPTVEFSWEGGKKWAFPTEM